MKRALLIVAILAAAQTGAAHAKGSTFVTFLTPSGNIGCGYSSGMGPRSLRCDIASGLKPRPRRPTGCVHLNWGDSYTMNVRGRAILTCHGDTAIIKSSKVIAYGKTWSRGGFECWSRSSGLTCKNASHHGWFLSRRHSYRF
ncbi:MAG TPA: DUF6636 domain-containing protein [Gaiellaceae bacterium]|nr:DUF6636 domain-containing protein [Gaiellaceae bacterium]